MRRAAVAERHDAVRVVRDRHEDDGATDDRVDCQRLSARQRDPASRPGQRVFQRVRVVTDSSTMPVTWSRRTKIPMVGDDGATRQLRDSDDTDETLSMQRRGSDDTKATTPMRGVDEPSASATCTDVTIIINYLFILSVKSSPWRPHRPGSRGVVGEHFGTTPRGTLAKE